MSGHGDGIGPGMKTRGGKKVIVRTALAPGDPRPAIAMKICPSSSKPPSDPVNASNNDGTDADTARNTTKRLQKKTAPVVSKKKSKKSAEENVPEHTVEATFQPPNLGNSADPVNASYNDAMEVEAANNTTKRSGKKLAPAVSKKKSKNASEGAIVENNVEATMQQLNLGNSAAGATLPSAAVEPTSAAAAAAASTAGDILLSTATESAVAEDRTLFSARFGQYVEAASRELDEETSNATAQLPVTAEAEAAPRCNWRHVSTECHIFGAGNLSQCNHTGCNTMLHHGCQTAWEFQHDAEADGCQKLCTVHHPYYHAIMHGAQGGGGTVVPTTTVVQHPYASPEMSELTGGPAVTPMPPLPKLPGMQSDKDILSLVQEEQEGDVEKEADALADFFDCHYTQQDNDDDGDNSNKDDNDTDNDVDDDDSMDDDMDDGGGDSDEEGPENVFLIKRNDEDEEEQDDDGMEGDEEDGEFGEQGGKDMWVPLRGSPPDWLPPQPPPAKASSPPPYHGPSANYPRSVKA